MKILLKNQSSKSWEELDPLTYKEEKELQQLLADSPSLIALDEIRADTSPLIVGVREIGLPGSGYTDILAFNEQGDIAIIECKREQNAEIKRKVVAQVLEYASFLWKMPYDKLNELILQRSQKSLDELIREKIGDLDWDVDVFRTNIQKTLDEGSFVIVIAVDEANEELLRTVRFLNNCGDPSFDFAILETRRYSRDNTEILVPHLITASIGPKHEPTSERKRWTKELFFSAAKEIVDDRSLDIMDELLQWTSTHADRTWFGTGKQKGSYTFHYLVNGKTASVFSVFTNGDFYLNFAYLVTVAKHEIMEEFYTKLHALPGFANVKPDFNKFPALKVNLAFPSNDDLHTFENIVEEVGKALKEAR